jgi:chromosome segregation protein
MEYERIRADLRLLLREWYGYHWHRLQGEVVHAREGVHAQEGRLERARERHAEVQVQMDDLRDKLKALRADLNEWHARSAALHTQWEKISRALAVMDERQRALLAQQQNLGQDLSRLEEEHKGRQVRLQDLIEEHDRLLLELEEAEAQVQAARKSLEKRQAERTRVEQAVRDTRRQLVQHETSQVQRKAHQSELSNRVEALRKNQASLGQTLSNESDLLEQLKVRLEKQNTLRGQAEQAQKDAEEALLAHRKSLADLEARRKQAQDERARCDGDRARLAAQLDVLEQAERSLSGMSNGARFIVQEARQGRLKGGYQALSAALVVPAEYETAIAAALGELLDGVVVEAGTDPEHALQLLARSAKGRAALLPADWTCAPEASVPLDDPGCVGTAASMVQAPDALRGIVDVLLGQVLVARDRAAARRMASLLPAGARAVTLQGEVFYSSGVVVAGPENRSSTIGRPRRIQELQSSLTVADETIRAVQQRMKETDAEIVVGRSRERELDTAARQSVQAAGKAGQEQQRAVLEVEQVRQRHEYQSRQLAGLDAQIQRAEQELRQEQQEIEKNNQKIAELNEQVREQNRRLASLPLDELQSQAVHWQTAVAVAARAVKEAERRLAEHRESVVAGKRQIELLHQRLEQAAAALANLETEKSVQRSQEQALNEQIEGLRRQIEPAEAQMQAVEKESMDQQAVLTAAQQGVSVAERHSTQAQIELTRVRESLDSLRRRIEEDFGLVTLEYNAEISGPTPLPLEGMVEQLPALSEIAPEIEESINRQRALLRRMGPINPEVQTEYQSVKERFDFLTAQVADLRKADADLREVIAALDDLMRKEFRKTFDAVAAEFKGMFTRLFGGGSARLILSDDENPTEAGIDIEARLPGRREQGLSLLSGGERSLTAVALICSLLKVSPTPFCVMDEVDAMLDEANVGRFRDLLQELSARTQFLIVTHNRNTVQAANVIYGVTMSRDSASQVISLRLDEIDDEMVR